MKQQGMTSEEFRALRDRVSSYLPDQIELVRSAMGSRMIQMRKNAHGMFALAFSFLLVGVVIASIFDITSTLGFIIMISPFTAAYGIGLLFLLKEKGLESLWMELLESKGIDYIPPYEKIKKVS